VRGFYYYFFFTDRKFEAREMVLPMFHANEKIGELPYFVSGMLPVGLLPAVKFSPSSVLPGGQHDVEVQGK
jgi:hypothetical protein